MGGGLEEELLMTKMKGRRRSSYPGKTQGGKRARMKGRLLKLKKGGEI